MRTATLNPDRRSPTVQLHFPKSDRHRGRLLRDWLKEHLSGSLWWNGSAWETNGIGINPTSLLETWGFTVTDDLNTWSAPVTKLSTTRRHVLVRPRLTGRTACQQLLGLSAVWDARRGLFRLPIADVCPDGMHPRPGLEFSDAAIESSRAVHAEAPAVSPKLQQVLTRASHVIRPRQLSRADRDLMVDTCGRLPDWFARELYPYQKVGSMAVACGRRLLADEPGVGKTTQAIAATALLGAHRVLVIAPPLVITNWCRELEACGVNSTDATVGAFTLTPDTSTRRRQSAPPPDDPDRPVAVVVSDSLLAARDQLARELTQWRPDVILWDEAHRGKTYGSKRSEAVLGLRAATGAVGIAITGTPMLKSPAELAPLMEFTQDDVAVFGGLGAMLDATCRLDRHNRLRPNRKGEAWLAERLEHQVMIRRRKTDVLPQLPPKRRHPVHVNVPLAEFRTAHRDIQAKIDDWLKAWETSHGGLPDDDAIAEYASGNLSYISQLRQAAGLCKVDAAVKLIGEHLAQTDRDDDGAYTDPLVVWTHHRAVTEALAAAVSATTDVAVISGATPRGDRDRIIDDFQAGRIGALVCSIHAAGVGITLTRCHTMLFVETDWTPGIVIQAEDRAHRAGQTAQSIDIGTMIAEDTLDPIIQRTLATKAQFLDATIGGDNAVSVDDSDDITASELLISLINDRRRRML